VNLQNAGATIKIIMRMCLDGSNTEIYFLILYNSASSLPNICSCKHTHYVYYIYSFI